MRKPLGARRRVGGRVKRRLTQGIQGGASTVIPRLDCGTQTAASPEKVGSRGQAAG
ncbi:MAG: hypothetical protein HYW48_00905 [Deltaproteobacteria bacterium]|nr:hypothetical protein [Deltaproteobacteria bacterium]